MYRLLIIFFLLVVSGCGGVTPIKYTPMPMDYTEAKDTVEELILTQHQLWKPDSLELNNKYIAWNFGYVSKGGSTSVVIPGTYVAVGSSRSTTRHKNERLYFRAIKSIQLSTWSRRLKKWYVVSTLDKHGNISKHILHTRNREDAERFTDAMNALLIFSEDNIDEVNNAFNEYPNIIPLKTKYKKNSNLIQRQNPIPDNYGQDKVPSSSIEIIESNGYIIFSNLPENSRLKNAGIFIGDRLLSVNGDSVNSTNIHAMKETLKEHEVEISIFGKGITRIRGNDVVKKF